LQLLEELSTKAHCSYQDCKPRTEFEGSLRRFRRRHSKQLCDQRAVQYLALMPMTDLLRTLGTRSYLVSGCGIEAAKKDRDSFDARWLHLLGLEEFYLESLRIQQIAQVHLSKNQSGAYKGSGKSWKADWPTDYALVVAHSVPTIPSCFQIGARQKY
jgi:hypothetical protein